MKKLIVIALMMVGGLQMAVAQNTIASIRKAYQEQKNVIAEMAEDFPYDGYPPCYYHLSVVMNLPATGLHRENIRMYFGEKEQDEEEDYNPYPPHYLSFLTTKYNYAAREFYEEYLYDNQGQLMFIYAQTPDIDMSKMHELRLYFDGQKLLRLNVKASEELESYDDTAVKKAGFKDVYTGTTIPEAYKEFCDMYKSKAEQFLGMFKSIDNVVY
jgi:hypothetical protein